METPLRGRSGGHTGAAPTMSHVAPCPKVVGEVLAAAQTCVYSRGEGLAADIPRCLSQEKVLADGQKRKTHPKMRISGVGFRLNRLRKWLSWRLDCEIIHFFIIFAAEKIKPV